MENKEVLKIIEPNPRPVRLFFFWTGIIATIAYRVIIVLNFYSPLLVKIAWYIGTVGFIFYFGHRFNIARKRAKLVQDYRLIEVVDNADCLDSQKKLALHYLVETSLTSKSKWNSGLIFILSFIALIIGIFIDFVVFK